jgi:hypothetical protein
MTIAAQTLGGTQRFCYVPKRKSHRSGATNAARDADHTDRVRIEMAFSTIAQNGPARNPICKDSVKQVLDYESETGIFRWKVRTSLRIHAGDIAGAVDKKGYIQIGIDGSRFAAHRLAWVFIHGCQPPNQIDHIDLNKSNNRSVNLREATNSQNQANQRLSSRNTSGFKGVYWSEISGRWISKICVNGSDIYLGCFGTPEDAHARYVEASGKYFGEFARAE